MTRKLKMIPLAMLAAIGLSTPAAASVADNWPVPGVAPALTSYGAIMPYTRYDCNEAKDATLKGGATLIQAKDFDNYKKATSASDQTYVGLPVGASVAWKATTEGDGVTIRYTIKDSHNGQSGKAGGYAEGEGHLEIYVNGQKAGDMPISSYHMYQYFSYGSGSPTQSGANSAPAFCFDERHVQLSKMVKPGDTIEVKCTKGSEVGVDFLELEVVPEELDPNDDANGRAVFNVLDYGAKAGVPSFDNRGAFEKCFNAASKVGGIMFVPKGTWYMGNNGEGGHGMLSLHGKNVKVMGAGIWHTNIQFTGWKMFGGGISGGNPSNTGFNDMDNIEWCHMYINSNLADRLGENAVYKCFMDIWCNGSVLHDIWEQHFECGFWFGDYNSNVKRASEVKVVNCRIRDNFADGVNFCEGTSNSAVFNCSIRNNGDDGLACWDSPKAGIVEQNNTFCYNTIDFIWRAGAIAIYGGRHQKAYNNYICDTFMASGIHANDIFSRGAIEDVTIEENILVRCGTLWESWGRDYGAIDFEGTNVANVKNNYLYDCPAEALRIKGNNSGVIIDGLYVNGAGISGGEQHYSASAHSAGLGNVADAQFTLKNMKVVKNSVPQPTEGAELNQYKTWPWWDTDPGYGTAWTWIEPESEQWCTYIPPYPTPKGVVVPPDPFENLTNYNFVLTGLDWLTNQGKHSMYDGDQVNLKIRVDYKGSQTIEAGARINFQLTVDGTVYTVSDKDGWQPNSYKIIEFPTAWTATKGQHTFTATIDPNGKLKNETNKGDNTRVKNVNVREVPEGEEPEIQIPTHSGKDMGVVKVYFEKADGSSMDEVNVGDELIPYAIVANYGSQTMNLGSGQGVLWGFGGSPEYMSGMLWDDSSHTIAPGEWIVVTPNGGGNQSVGGWTSRNTYIVEEGTVDLYCRMDNPNNYGDDTTDNNMNFVSYTFPKKRPVYNDNPDKADNLNTGGLWEYEDDDVQGGGDSPVTGFDLVPTGIVWEPGDETINAGEELKNFSVFVKNSSNVALPAGKNVRVTLYIDGQAKGNATYGNGISANSAVEISIPVSNYVATAGGHTVKAMVGNVSGEASFDNNSRERTFNAQGGSSVVEPDTEYVTGYDESKVNGVSVLVRRVFWQKVDGNGNVLAGEPIRPGDRVKFSAEIYNNGSQATAAKKHGLLFETWPAYDPKFWSDDSYDALAPGQSRILTTCGGSNDNKGIWTAKEGDNQFRVWFDDGNMLGVGNNGKCQFIIDVEITGEPAPIDFIEMPTGADNRDNIDTGVENIEAAEAAEEVWYNLQGIRIERPTAAGVYIRNGKKVLVK